MLKGLFGNKTFLEPYLEDWVFEAFAWLMRNSGGLASLKEITLAGPSREHFAPTEATGHKRALYVFDRVKSMMGIPHWPCELHPFATDDRHRQLSEAMGLAWKTNNPAGLFQIKDGQAFIWYDVRLVERPPKLIAVLAHELAHYLLHAIREEPPGGEDAHELLTELTVAYAGFGVFGANAAYEFEGDARGWRSSRSGYLSEQTWAFALALFCELRGYDENPSKWLKPNVGGQFEKASAYLRRNLDKLAPLLN